MMDRRAFMSALGVTALGVVAPVAGASTSVCVSPSPVGPSPLRAAISRASFKLVKPGTPYCMCMTASKATVFEELKRTWARDLTWELEYLFVDGELIHGRPVRPAHA